MSQVSLRVRMVAVFSLLITGFAVFMIEFFPARMAEQARAQAEFAARTMTQVMASAIAPALEFDDSANATRLLTHLASSPDVKFAVVLGDASERFAAWHPEHIPAELSPAANAVDGALLITSAPIVGRAGGRGTLYIGQSLQRLLEDRDAAREAVVSAAIVVLAIGLVICALLATALVRPLERLTTIARDIARGAKPPRITAISGGREVLEMTRALGTMLDRVHDANRQLVEASRHAGMAEVATGVLHNVGNILTSINVGIAGLAERAAALPADRLRRAGQLLAAGQVDGTIEPRKLDAGVCYLGAVADQLAADRDQLLADVGALRGHVDHVNRVVAMQNAFARTGDVNEEVELATLIDEALALGCPDAERRGLTITCAVEPARRIMTDRHRVLQIAVNLLANARDSVIAHRQRLAPDAALGQITVRARVDDGWLGLAIDDDGGGIAPETLSRIFAAGFTTKVKGHGYGLHSSALAAEHLRGTLRCNSAGIDRGASFVLRIPVEPARSHD
ncbi:MAG TPA: ATP-binding protein [Kofleriaceae bacterium]|nr:ATP-binding protein [Kofleriaceae bacterium]